MPISGFVGSGSSVGGVAQTEIDFGTAALRSQTFLVEDPNVTPSSLILAFQSADAPTDKSADENEFDVLLCRATPASSGFMLFVDSLFGPVKNKFKINYLVA